MNYWPSEITNLTETNEPLVQMLKELSVTGQQTAKTMYNANGWVLHHNTDLWRFNGAIDGAPGLWPTGAAWLCQNLWEKYKFNDELEKNTIDFFPVSDLLYLDICKIFQLRG